MQLLSKIKHRAPLIAFVILAIGIGFALNGQSKKYANTLYKSQIEACQRGNILRTESNNRIPAHDAEALALREFLMTARVARLKAYKTNHQTADKEAAEKYLHLANFVTAKVQFKPVSIVNCIQVISKP